MFVDDTAESFSTDVQSSFHHLPREDPISMSVVTEAHQNTASHPALTSSSPGSAKLPFECPAPRVRSLMMFDLSIASLSSVSAEIVSTVLSDPLYHHEHTKLRIAIGLFTRRIDFDIADFLVLHDWNVGFLLTRAADVVIVGGRLAWGKIGVGHRDRKMGVVAAQLLR